MKRGNVSAFTIMEILINMAIMSIVISMVYFSYSSFVKQITYYQMNIEEQSQLDRFCLQLKTDFFEAEKIIKSEHVLEVFFYNMTSVKYSVKEKFLVRTKNQNKDSLKIKNIDFITILNSNANNELVKRIKLTTYLFNQPIEFIAIKQYPIMLEQQYYGD